MQSLNRFVTFLLLVLALAAAGSTSAWADDGAAPAASPVDPSTAPAETASPETAAPQPAAEAKESPAPVAAASAPVAPVPARDGRGRTVYVIAINTDTKAGDMIDRHHHYLIHRKLAEAERTGAAAFILELNTNGGTLDAALMINERLLSANLPTATYVTNRAISAGAMIAMSTDTIFVQEGSSIGAAMPVTASGEGMKSAEAKVVAAVAAQMRAAAEAKGHPVPVAEAMVDTNHPLEGYGKEGDLLSLTANEAIAVGLAAKKVTDLQDVLRELGLQGAKIVHPKLTVLEGFAAQLSRPAIISALMAIAFIALIIEFKSPGVGLPLGVALVCFGMAQFGSFMADLSGLLEPLLLLIGLVLVGVEIFVLPGFGVAGIAGTVCVFASFGLMMNNMPSSAMGIFTLWMGPTVFAILGSLIAAMVGLPIVLKLLPYVPYFNSLVAEEPAPAPAGPSFVPPPVALRPGMVGIADTDCRPIGSAKFGEERVEVMSDGKWITKGTPILVKQVQGKKVLVAPTPGRES